MKKNSKKFCSLLLSFSLLLGLCLSAEARSNCANVETTILSEFTDENTREISYDEMISNIAQNRNITIEEAKAMFPNEATNPQTKASITYKYVESRRVFTVTNEYKPRVYFYIYMGYDSTGKPVGMSRVVDYALDRTNTLNNSIKSKQFSGDLFVELLNAKELYYRVSGDFYDNGTMTYSGGVSIGLGESSSMNFGLSGGTNHYKYCFFTETSRIV